MPSIRWRRAETAHAKLLSVSEKRRICFHARADMDEINFLGDTKEMKAEKRVLWSLCVWIVAGMILGGCAGKKSDNMGLSSSKYKIGVSIPSAEYTFFVTMDGGYKSGISHGTDGSNGV